MKNTVVEADMLDARYPAIFGGMATIIDATRQSAVRSVNAAITDAYWLVGWAAHRGVRAVKRWEGRMQDLAHCRASADLMKRFMRCFRSVNLSQMKKFSLLWSVKRIFQTPSEKLEFPKSLYPR